LKAKKQLGQHFLTDQTVVYSIIEAIKEHCDASMSLLEVGPGKGVLTEELSQHFPSFKAVEFDRDMVAVLSRSVPDVTVIQQDFLRLPVEEVYPGQFNLVGNFPYNISSQILFKLIENRDKIPCMVGMFQKEVADRICAGPKGRVNGIISIRAQAHYRAEKLFDIAPSAFSPPPKVQSSIIVLHRRDNYELDCDMKLFSQIVKMAYGQRRKKMRNTIKSIVGDLDHELLQHRPEELSVEQFVTLTKLAEQNKQ